MGWLFGKKKPKVPLPEGHPVEGSLRFPNAPPSGKVIEPDKVKEAVGLEQGVPPAESEEMPDFPSQEMEMAPQQDVGTISEETTSRDMERQSFSRASDDPLYIKVDVYQHILGEIDDLKLELSHLSETQRLLEKSEFNEEANFEQLKKTVKNIHDRLLQVDKTLFRAQGE